MTPDLIGATVTQNAGIIGESVDLTLEHTKDMRYSTLVYQLTAYLAQRWRPDDTARPHLFNQLKGVVRNGSIITSHAKVARTPRNLRYKTLADTACERIIAGINLKLQGEKPILAVLDPYTPTWNDGDPSASRHRRGVGKPNLASVTSTTRCLTATGKAEFCRVAEAHPRVRAYVKNQGLGFEVPYRCGSIARRYGPDFIVRVEDGHGEDDLLNLIVEIKGYRREDAKDKKLTMDTYWVPGVNNLGTFGRWAFTELREVYQIESGFAEKVEEQFGSMINDLSG